VNTYTPQRYDEQVRHLALGIELRDAASGLRVDSGVDVRTEKLQSPVDQWRAWRPGETLTMFLPPMDRHRSGRFTRLYSSEPPTTVRLRVIDDARNGFMRIAGQGRRIVPRRIQVDIATAKTVADAEADPAVPPHPVWRRAFPLWCFPGSAADLPPRSTVLRGTIRRLDTTLIPPRTVPVRWARVRARNAAGDDVGWAHGDERGEFVLVVEPSSNDIVVPADPLPVTLTISATLPPTAPDAADPKRAVIDPLWDLPLETVTPAPAPAGETSLTGRRFLPGQVVLSPLSPPPPIALPLERETSVVIRIA
jgi:hypothetical protein